MHDINPLGPMLQLKELKRQAAPKLRPLLPSQQTPNIANLGASNRMHKMVRAPAYICAVARSYEAEEKTDERVMILGVGDRQRQSTEGAASRPVMRRLIDTTDMVSFAR